MSQESPIGCARPTGGPVGKSRDAQAGTIPEPVKEEPKMIHVGKPAPDFVAPAYHKGVFTSLKLSDHLGKWISLCFYPGDFTFV